MDFIKNVGFWSVNAQSFMTVAVLTICILLYTYILRQFRRDPRLVEFAATLPGPPTVSLLGNGFDFYREGTNAMKKLVEYSEKYGSIYRIWLGKHLLIGLSDPHDLEVVFGSSRMLGKPQICKPFEYFGGNGIFSGPVHIWKKNRKRIQPALGNDLLALYVPEMNEKIYAMVDKMKNLINGPTFDLWEYLPYLSFDIVTKTALDVELDSHDKAVLQFHNHVKIALENCFLKMFKPWLHIELISDLFWKNNVEHARNCILSFSKQIVATKFKEMKQKLVNYDSKSDIDVSDELSMTPFLKAIYQLKLEAHDEKLMHDELVTMIIGGTDTVAITNGFFLLSVAMYPDIQEKLYDELYEVFEDGDQPADLNDLPRLPYLDQVLKETMRRFTLLPAIFRQVEEDVQIGSRLFPAGTELMISLYGVHMNPEHYPNPREFNPENFAPDAVAKRHKLTFLPFSSGPRNCIGQNFGFVEVKLTLIALLRTFSFHTDIKIEDLIMNVGFLMTSVEGYKIHIKQRDRRPSYLRKRDGVIIN